MPTISPLATLVAILAEVCQQARQHQQLLSKNEAATRAALIDPVLRALGWDTANVAMVEPEKTINAAWRADYALHNASGQLEMLIEAKCLGTNLEKYSVVQQLLSYAFGFGTTRLIITDGISWHFYSQFKPGSTVADSHFNMLHDTATVCAMQLVQWLDVTQAGYSQFQLLPAVDAVPHPISTPLLPTRKRAAIISFPLAGAKEKATKSWVPLRVDLAIPGNSPGKPAWLRLSDGSEHSLKTWKDILVRATEIVLQNQEKLPVPLPDKAGKKISLLSWSKPDKDRSYQQFTYHGKNVFLDTHYSAQGCVANALLLLQLLPKIKQQVEPAIAFAP